jgi:hypothetical protein
MAISRKELVIHELCLAHLPIRVCSRKFAANLVLIRSSCANLRRLFLASLQRYRLCPRRFAAFLLAVPGVLSGSHHMQSQKVC